jgi:hypothetical protein
LTLEQHPWSTLTSLTTDRHAILIRGHEATDTDVVDLLSLPIVLLRPPLKLVVGLVVTPVRIVGGLERTLANLDALIDSIDDMRHDVARMRYGVDLLGAEVRGLRGDVGQLNGGVDGIHSTMGLIDDRVEQLSFTLKSVDALAARLGWLGKARGGRHRDDDELDDLAAG